MKGSCIFLQLTLLLSLLESFASTSNPAVDGIRSSGGVEGTAEVQFARKNNNLLDIYWINLDRSTQRRDFMNTVYDFYGLTDASQRFSALTPADIAIPEELESAPECNLLKESDTLKELGRVNDLLPDPIVRSSKSRRQKVLLTSHCARYSFNRKLLATTLSHLLIIYQAVHHHKSKKYALIMEDDLQPAMEIDFDRLIKSAPKDFGMLQLVSSHSESVEENWNHYREKRLRWRRRGHTDNNWCAGAYIVHKERLRPIISKLIRKVNDQLYMARVIAVGRNCSQLSCCNPEVSIVPKLPCVLAPRGYEADNFIFNMHYGHSYVSCVPLFLSSAVGNRSTIHQEHVEVHTTAFERMKELIDYMVHTDTGLLPNYVNPARRLGAAF
jgi:GR25 family glycosyltransferase involved in LPS biosynthesis